ncbi:DNA type IV secretion system protein ComB10 [Helicobacter baculiformis]|uniref:DNA type IV secretion system protein ComB10 n=1 Tax=Helicobacter baculiformis TaxID=427351 RepID=A0ABV7ZHX4_9HELI|nr:DNA type IV secretion system protein ComB10 [Helicobacter baculiformis]
MRKWARKIALSLGAMGGIIALSLWVHRPALPSPTPVPQLEEVNYPLADYLFEPPKTAPKEPPTTTSNNTPLQEKLEANARHIEALQAALQQTKKRPSPPPKPDSSLERELEQDRLDMLAMRIQAFETSNSLEVPEETQALEIDYGSKGFENLKAKDIATHENKLSRTLTADKMIPAFLITPISSQLAGKIIAQVESDIFANMGRAVLIPKGSKVIGYYNNNNKIGDYRLDIIWTRIITPHGVNIMLTNAKGADVKGYSGLVGEVITHNFQRYGMPLLVSTLSNGLLIALTSAIANKTGKNNLFGDFLLMQLTRQTGMGLNQIIAQILKDKSKLNPIITIKEGSRVFISPNLDIFFPIPKEGEVMAEFFQH